MTKPADLTPLRASLLGGAALVFAGLLAYGNSLHGPFVFDDLEAIRDNLTIRHFGSAFFPPPGALPVSGRPLVNLSFALNYAVSGLDVGSYHAVNLLIHLLAGLTLFGILRRTLAPAAAALAWLIALLWIVHPLGTEAVTYVSQRAESLMGLFYLLTLYGFIRGAEGRAAPTTGKSSSSGQPLSGWLGVSWLACLLGMATKEVMVSAPLMVLLYDRTFVSGSFREAWRRRRVFFLSLTATWALLLFSVASAGATRGGTSGLAMGASWGPYLFTQFEAVARYLGLSFWPAPLIFYYESFWIGDVGPLLLYALVVVPLAVGTVWACWRRPAVGFLGVWFFAILAPSSLVPNAIQMMAEHRMYLPLAAVLTAGVLGIARIAGRTPCVMLCGLAGVGFTIVTAERNGAYHSGQALWADTVAKRPNNVFARNNLGEALAERGLWPQAVAQYREALRLDPSSASIYAYINLGVALDRMSRSQEAIATDREALRLKPDWALAHTGLADALTHAGQLDEARAEYERALRIKSGYPRAENGLGFVLFRSGRIEAAIPHFEAALRLSPDYAEAYGNLGAALFSVNRVPAAIAAYQRALQLEPDNADIHFSLGNAFYQANRPADAAQEYGAALRLRPGSAEDHDHYGILLVEVGRLPEAEAQFQEAQRLAPANAAVQDHLRRVQAAQRRTGGAGTSPP